MDSGSGKKPTATVVGRPARRAIAALGLATCAEWAIWVVVLVLAFERGGAAATGFTSLALLVTAAVVTLVAGSVPDRSRPNRTFLLLVAIQAAGFLSAALAVWLFAPLWVVVALVASALGCVSLLRPTIAVVVPALVRTPLELTRAHVRITAWESMASLAGPLLAGAAIAVGGVVLGFTVSGLLAVLGAMLLMSMWSLQLPSGRAEGEPPPRLTAVVRQFWRVLRDAPTRALLTVAAARDMVVGATDILIVVIALDVLDLGSASPGWLTALGGVGSLAGSAIADRFVGRPRLAPMLFLGAGLVATVFALLSVETAAFSLAATLVAAGLGGTFVTVAARILLQRAAPQDAIAALFSVAEVVALAATAVGALIVQTLIVVWSVEVALLGLGGVVVGMTLLVARPLARVDQHADAPVVTIRLLRRTPLFAPLPAPELEGVARAAETRHYSPGEVIVTEGEPGEHYFVIVDGQVDVFVAGTPRRVMGPDDGFGEIALLSVSPRTATVVARVPVEVLALSRADFLAAVTGHDATRQAAWAVAHGFDEDDRRESGSDGRRTSADLPEEEADPTPG